MTEKSTILCEAVFNEDKTHRYAWKRVWDSKKPELCIITLNPNSRNVFELDLTSMLVTDNAYRLKEYGGVNIVNLFSVLTDKLKASNIKGTDKHLSENIKYIKKICGNCKDIIIAWGKAGNINKNIKDREQLVLNELKPFSNKLYTLVDYNGETGLHPLTPSVRKGWSLVPFKDTEAK